MSKELSPDNLLETLAPGDIVEYIYSKTRYEVVEVYKDSIGVREVRPAKTLTLTMPSIRFLKKVAPGDEPGGLK